MSTSWSSDRATRIELSGADMREAECGMRKAGASRGPRRRFMM
jgi:hypothetical protein